MKKKVAIIDPLGGHESSHHFYLFGQAHGLIKNEVKVSLYTNNETINPKISGLKFYQFFRDIFLSRFQVISGIRYIFGSILSIFHARINGCKIFHFHIFYTNILVLFNIILVKLLFAKVVLTIHDVNSFTNNDNYLFFQSIIYDLSDSILTHNNFSKEEILKIRSYNHKERKISIIPHGNYIPFINIQKNKLSARKFLGISSDKKVILFFGLIKEVKGLEILLDALNIVKDKLPNILLLIVGKVWKNDFTYYQTIIDQHNLQNYCFLKTNYIPDAEVRYYFGSCDLVVLPYKKIFQSGVLMMAMSYDKPVLVSDLLPLKEIINDGKNGFTFESENYLSLADRLVDILNDEQLLERVNINNQELIKNQFCWSKIGKQTKMAYKAIS